MHVPNEDTMLVSKLILFVYTILVGGAQSYHGCRIGLPKHPFHHNFRPSHPRQLPLMGNEALSVNPPNADYHLTTNGSDWLWAAFSIFGVSFLVTVALAFRVSPSDCHG